MSRYDIEELCCEYSLVETAINELIDCYSFFSNNYSSVAIICKEELAEKIIKILSNTSIDDEDFMYQYLDFDKYDYGNEYGVIIVKEDSKLSLNVEKVFCKDGKCKSFEEDVVFISDEVNSKILVHQINSKNNVVCFSVENDCE